MRIGVAQIKLHSDFDKNIAHCIATITSAAESNIDMLCFPESAVMSYPIVLKQGLNVQKDMPRIKTAINRIHDAARSRNMHVIVGTPYNEDNTIYNAAFALLADGSQFRYYKNRLTEQESPLFTAGNKLLVFRVQNISCGILICRDQNYTGLARKYRDDGVQILFLLAAHYYPPEQAQKKIDKNRALPIARAVENHIYVVKANAVGTAQDLVNFGGSIIVDPDGAVLAEADAEHEMTIYQDITL